MRFIKKYKKHVLTLVLTLITVGVLALPHVKALESTEVIIIDSSDFVIYSNDLYSASGGTGGLIQFKATYDYYNNHDSTPITISGFNLVSIIDSFKYNIGVGGYTVLDMNNFNNYSISIISTRFISGVETVTPITDYIYNGRDIVLENNAMDTAQLTIYLNFTLDPLNTPPYNATYQDHIIDNNFNFKIYESDYALGYEAGYDLGLTIDAQNARAQGYYEGKAEFGYFDPITRKWLGYEDGYNIGLDKGLFDGYNNGIEYALNTYPYDIYLNGFRSAYRNPIDNSILDDEDSYSYGQGYNAGIIVNNSNAYNEGYNDGSADIFMSNFDKWIVPAILIIMFLGGFIAYAKFRNGRD